MSDIRSTLKDARRIVVKVGTSTLTHTATSGLNFFRIDRLIQEIADLHNSGREIILVTSGAIAAGIDRMRLNKKPDTIPENQALAAIGQGVLMHAYEKVFAEYGKTMAQLLLTGADAANAHARENSRNSLMAILKMGAIPVINENDAVAVDEIKIGDNDNLSAIVATLIDADLLIILTDIDGFYTDNPKLNPSAQLIDEIEEITPEIERLAGGPGTKLGTGGMYTKVSAAKAVLASGIPMLIAPGSELNVLRRIINGDRIGTVFSTKLKRSAKI